MNAFVTDTTGAAYESGGWDSASAMLMEAAELIDDYAGRFGGNAPATHTGGPIYRFDPYAKIYDRADGRFLPFYEHEQDLRIMWSQARILPMLTPVMEGMRRALEVYVMGGQWQHEAKPADGYHPPADLLGEVQRIIDANLELNQFEGGLDRDIFNAGGEDGDCIVGVYARHDGLSDWRRIDAPQVCEPAAGDPISDWLSLPRAHAHWKFGVLTVYDDRMRRIDHARPAGYHVAYDDAGRDWDFLPSWPQPHIPELRDRCAVMYKCNAPADAKRGVADSRIIQGELERDAKLVTNTAVGASVLAAIPWFEKLASGQTPATNQHGHQQSAMDAFRGALRQAAGDQPRREVFKPGTVRRVSPNVAEIIAGPVGASRQTIFLEVSQHLMRRAGIAKQMPEYMISGDASNANFASTLVSESPFTKARQSDQDRVAQFIRSIHWRALRLAHLAGRFDRWGVSWPELRKSVHLVIEGPEVASRDKAALVNELNQGFDRGLIDANEWRRGTDREEKPGLVGTPQVATATMAEQVAPRLNSFSVLGNG